MQLSSSNLYKHSGYQCKISPNGSYLANSVDNRLVIRKSAADLTILHVFDCLHLIKHVEWSPDSRYVMTANYQTATIQVWSVTNTHWRSKIHDASFGITRAWWGPASQSIICSSELSLRLSVWMLKENRVIYMKYPKFTDKGCEVSPDGKYLAVIENRSGKDCISVYTAPDIQLVKHFQLDTEDVANIRWSPNSHYIAAWDNCLYYKLVIYRPDGHLCASYQAYGEGLGIKSICWSRDSQLLAVGSYDQKVRILRTCSWDTISELFHAAAIKQLEYSSASIYRELQRTSSTGPIAYDHIVRRPVNIPILRPEYSASNPKTGVGMCQFNANGHLLCTRDDGIPTTLWVWDTTKFQCLYIIMQQRAIKQVAWHPTNPNMLTFTCDTNTLYIVIILLDLDTNGDSTARRIQISPVAGPSGDFVIRKFRFVPDGSSVLLMDKTLFGLISIS